jgi:hypothetical protein
MRHTLARAAVVEYESLLPFVESVRGDTYVPSLSYPEIKQEREAAAGGLSPFPGHGRPRYQELARLRKENKVLRETNEILKKAAVIFAQGEPQ